MEYTWTLNGLGLITNKIQFDDQLWKCDVLDSDQALYQRYLPNLLIYSSPESAMEHMDCVKFYCGPSGYVLELDTWDEISTGPKWTFASDDREIGLIIGFNHIDTDYENYEFDQIRLLLITKSGNIEKGQYRFRYQINSDPLKINRMKEKEYRAHKLLEAKKKSIIDIGVELLKNKFYNTK